MFRAAGFAGGPTVFFTAPAGYVTVVKQISIVIGATLLEASAWVEDDAGGKLAWAHASDAVTTSPFTSIFLGPWTLLAGESLSPATSLPTIADFYASGYLLALP
jgi:hypothetical protein